MGAGEEGEGGAGNPDAWAHEVGTEVWMRGGSPDTWALTLLGGRLGEGVRAGVGGAQTPAFIGRGGGL